MNTVKKPVTLAMVAFVSGLSMGQPAAADVSKKELKSISTPNACSDVTPGSGEFGARSVLGP